VPKCTSEKHEKNIKGKEKWGKMGGKNWQKSTSEGQDG
jgi:hypothetical protein